MTPILKPSQGGYTYNGISYDSKEEIYFSWYLDELFEAGYIDEYCRQPEPFSLFDPVRYNWILSLKTKKKEMTTTLLRAHSYQADFKIEWNASAINLFFDINKLNGGPFFSSEYGTSFIDVKPSFDMQNMTRLFTINQKWVYQRFGVYVQKIVPQKLFKATFTPNRYLYTDKSSKPRKIDYPVQTLTEFIRG